MNHDLILSGFADEAALDKTVDQQLAAMSALGLQYLSIRFVDVGKGIQNVLELNDEGFDFLAQRLNDYGLKIATIGSPIGKVKIADVEDGTSNRFVPFSQYVDEDVNQACHAASQLNCRLIRGFSFYHPRGSMYQDHLQQSIDQLGKIAEVCDSHGLTFGLEVEANLIGHTGQILRQIFDAVQHPALMLIFDGGNLVTQGFDAEQILKQFRDMIGGLGWMHVKDYQVAAEQSAIGNRYVDEEALDRFVPADQGATDHLSIFKELKNHLPGILQRLNARSIPGFVIDLEPHLRGGGQFGGFSGPDGMGIALRSLCRVMEQADLAPTLKQFHDI